MNIYLDFDGTVVEHKYPEIGQYNPGAFDVITKLIGAGHNLILNTYRVEISKVAFQDAYTYLVDGLGINSMKHTMFKKHPIEWDFNIFRDLDEIHIDDTGFRHPMRRDIAMIDWARVDLEFEANGIY